jgi:hypothetical protein
VINCSLSKWLLCCTISPYYNLCRGEIFLLFPSSSTHPLYLTASRPVFSHCMFNFRPRLYQGFIAIFMPTKSGKSHCLCNQCRPNSSGLRAFLPTEMRLCSAVLLRVDGGQCQFVLFQHPYGNVKARYELKFVVASVYKILGATYHQTILYA